MVSCQGRLYWAQYHCGTAGCCERATTERADTQVIMAHYHLETEKGRNGDNAWPLWGLAMRLVTAVSTNAALVRVAHTVDGPAP
jgi:hypothetical protein